MQRRRLAKLFYEQAKTFAEIQRVPLEDIAAAQFHASLRLALDAVSSLVADDWIELRKTEYRTGIAEQPDWFERPTAINSRSATRNS